MDCDANTFADWVLLPHAEGCCGWAPKREEEKAGVEEPKEGAEAPNGVEEPKAEEDAPKRAGVAEDWPKKEDGVEAPKREFVPKPEPPKAMLRNEPLPQEASTVAAMESSVCYRGDCQRRVSQKQRERERLHGFCV